MGHVRTFYGHEGVVHPHGLLAPAAAPAAYPDGDPQAAWTVKELEAWAAAHDLVLPDGLKQVKVDAVLAHAEALNAGADEATDADADEADTSDADADADAETDTTEEPQED